MRSLCFATLLLMSTPLHGEQFLGEEPKSDSSAKPANQEESEAPKVRSKKSTPSSSGGGFGFSASLGAGAGYFAASGTLSYGFNSYLGISNTYHYERLEESGRFGEEHGSDVNFVIRIPNPTVVTPVAGAGPGYLYWSRKVDDKIFDENQSPIMNYFAGVNIALSRNFGVAIHRRKREFLRNVPIRYADQTTKEDRHRIDNSIGFYASF